MRIISQDGSIDLPYEQVIVERRANLIRAYSHCLYERPKDMAIYLTAEKAERVMAEMRFCWNKGKHIYKFPADDEVRGGVT